MTTCISTQPRLSGLLLLWTLLILATLTLLLQAAPARGEDLNGGGDQLLIDPMLLVALAECRNIVDQIPGGFYPGWDFASLPVLFYKPGVQDVLVNFPHRPEGFRIHGGFNPLGDETIYIRDGETFIEWDDQNTTREIDGVITLVVADSYSSLRNQLRGNFNNRSPEDVNNWLEDWSFQPSPYDKIKVILHEAFHAHQAHLAPDKAGDEQTVGVYPLLDPINNALSQMEGLVLRDALITKDESEFRVKAAEFSAIRRHRQGRLSQECIDYENLNEFSEGTAKYIEYRFLRDGQSLRPLRESYYDQGFQGFAICPELFENQLANMVKIIGVTDDRFGNKFGAGPLRFKLYDLGAAQSLMLDRIRPGWQTEIFADDVFLCELIHQSLALDATDEAAALARAKSGYDYDLLLSEKHQFKAEGDLFILAKVDEILKTDQTLVTLNYEAFEITGMGYTPFGVTQVGPESAIYDMVPLQVKFGEATLLSLKRAQPVLLDEEARELSFAISTPVDDFSPATVAGLDNEFFSLESKALSLAAHGNRITITLN